MRRATCSGMALAAAFGLIACEVGTKGAQTPAAPIEEDPSNAPLLLPAPAEAVEVEAGPGVQLKPPVTQVYTDVWRERRRMDLDQLSSAFRTVSGGIGWTEMRNGAEVDLFQSIASTLGKPDFINRTTEDLDPSAMFQKFLGDAARTVCAKIVDRDAALPVDKAADRALLGALSPTDSFDTAPTKVEANLGRLLTRFHGRPMTSETPDFHRWRWLYQSVERQSQSPNEGWRAVCIALYTHPDFYTY